MRGRPREPQKVEKINPVNIIKEKEEDTVVSYKCDNPKCASTADVFVNLKFCPPCARDKGLI